MSKNLIIGIYLLPLLLSSNVYAINKCVDEKGRVSFQDRPCVAQSQVKPSKVQASAAKNSNKFQNLTVDFSVTKLNDWNFITAEQNIENIKRLKLTDREFHENIIKYSNAPLVAMMKYPEPFDDVNPSFKVNIRPLGRLDGNNPIKILKIITPQFEKAFKDFKIVEAPQIRTVSGLKAAYMRIHYSMVIPDGRTFPTSSEMWIVPRGGYFFMIGAGTRQDEKTGTREEISRILSSIEL